MIKSIFLLPDSTKKKMGNSLEKNNNDKSSNIIIDVLDIPKEICVKQSHSLKVFYQHYQKLPTIENFHINEDLLHHYSRLNLATYINVPANLRPQNPIYYKHTIKKNLFDNIVLEVGENSNITFHEDIKDTQDTQRNKVIYLLLKEKSTCHFHISQKQSEKSIWKEHYFFILEDSASLYLYGKCILKGNFKTQSHTLLNEQNSQAHIKNYIEGKKESSIFQKITVQHNAPETKSFVLQNSISDDNSSINIIGNVHAKKNTSHAEARLEQKAFLAGKKAEISTIPALEVDHHKVKASHKSSFFSLNKDDIWYLNARGIGAKNIKALYKKGLLHEIFN